MKFTIYVIIMDMHNTRSPYTALAFDIGTKKVGVAVGESLTQNAKPLSIIKAHDGKPNFAAVENIIQEWRPNIIIVGIPINPNENEIRNSQTINIEKLALKFANKLESELKPKYRFDVHTIDEAFTSLEAKKIFTDLRQNKLIKQGAKLDDIAACIILERWFAKN